MLLDIHLFNWICDDEAAAGVDFSVSLSFGVVGGWWGVVLVPVVGVLFEW